MKREDYRPLPLRIERIRQETPDVRTLFMRFVDDDGARDLAWRPGQFMMLSVVGSGECTFCLTQSPTRPEFVEASIKRTGRVTDEFHDLREGDVVGFRGPYGNSFDVDAWKGRNLVFVAGGIGMAPVRSAIHWCLDHRADYGRITIVYGARSPKDLPYRDEIPSWRGAPNTDVHVTVDPAPAGGAWEGWTDHVGFVPTVLGDVAPPAADAVCVTCGPPIMIKFTLQVLERLGFGDDDIVTTLENRMQCGVGKCGRCNVGPVYVCTGGPVFTRAQLRRLPDEF